jgi:hypothetical protein
MNKFQKLEQLSKDIELLEVFGDIKSASILHKKFLKEAQSLTPSRNSDPYNKYFQKYFNSASTTPSKKLIDKISKDGFLYKQDQDQLISYINERLQKSTPVSSLGPNPNSRDDVPTSPQSTHPGDGLNVNKGNIIYPEDTANQNAKELFAEDMKKRIQYYENKIKEYHEKKDPKMKEKMLLYLSTYMDNNYTQGKLDSNSYSRLMNALGEKKSGVL